MEQRCLGSATVFCHQGAEAHPYSPVLVARDRTFLALKYAAGQGREQEHGRATHDEPVSPAKSLALLSNLLVLLGGKLCLYLKFME